MMVECPLPRANIINLTVESYVHHRDDSKVLRNKEALLVEQSAGGCIRDLSARFQSTSHSCRQRRCEEYSFHKPLFQLFTCPTRPQSKSFQPRGSGEKALSRDFLEGLLPRYRECFKNRVGGTKIGLNEAESPLSRMYFPFCAHEVQRKRS